MFDLSIVKRVLPKEVYKMDAVSEELAPTKPLNLRRLRGAAFVPRLEGLLTAADAIGCETDCPGPESGQPPVFTATLPVP